MITAKPFRILIAPPGGRGGWDGFWDECGKSFGILVREFEGEWNVKMGPTPRLLPGMKGSIRLPKSLHIRPIQGRR